MGEQTFMRKMVAKNPDLFGFGSKGAFVKPVGGISRTTTPRDTTMRPVQCSRNLLDIHDYNRAHIEENPAAFEDSMRKILAAVV